MRRALLAAFAFSTIWLAPAQPASALLCIPLTFCSCSVSATDIDVPDISPLHTTAQDAEGEVSVACGGLLGIPSVDVRLDDGLWGTFAARKMHTAGGDLLNYNVYTTNQHNTVWGDGTASTSFVTLSGGIILSGSWSRTQTMFARVSPLAATKPGEYSDTIVVRIDF